MNAKTLSFTRVHVVPSISALHRTILCFNGGHPQAETRRLRLGLRGWNPNRSAFGVAAVRTRAQQSLRVSCGLQEFRNYRPGASDTVIIIRIIEDDVSDQ